MLSILLIILPTLLVVIVQIIRKRPRLFLPRPTRKNTPLTLSKPQPAHRPAPPAHSKTNTSVNIHHTQPVSVIPPQIASPISNSYYHNAALEKNLARAHLISTLQYPVQALCQQLDSLPTMLPHLLRNRAIQLYALQNATHLAEAITTIDEFEQLTPLTSSLHQSTRPSSSFADPAVTILLLQAGYYDDALTYFCRSTGATRDEAGQALTYLAQDIEDGAAVSPHLHTPDPAAIKFLLQINRKITAIRYYHDCTGIALNEAKILVDAYPHNI